jgi:succinyl-diaminopimelate desuccinylase
VKYLLDHKLLKGDLAICEGPDTSLWVAHVGLLQLAITVEGKPSHAGRLWTGDNAILKMMKVIEVLQKTKAHFESLGTKYKADFVRYTTLNIGVINGGSKVNVVPGECRLQIDMRIAPDHKIEDVLKKVKEDIAGANIMPPPKIEIITREEPEQVSRDMKVFGVIRDVLKERQGRDIQFIPSHGINDSRWFRRYGIPAITFGGPGGPETGIGGHGADEFVRIEDLLQATKNLAIVLSRLLSQGV